jgi:uncharacterized protein
MRLTQALWHYVSHWTLAYGEERSVLLGMTNGQVLTVVYTERGDRIRIISAWRATRHERDYYYRQNAL